MLLKTMFLVLMTVSLWSACAMASAGERLTPAPGKAGRSVTMASHGMVATSQPLAAQIGLDVLKNGGNAIDAAIATNAALGLMEPMSCGIGGDLYAIVWDAKSHKLYGLNASGRSPYKATRAFFASKGLDEIPTVGPLSWSVPGCVDGWEELRKRFGTRTLAQLLEPTIRYAEEGFPVSPVIGGYWRGSEKRLGRHADAARTYLLDGRAPRAATCSKTPIWLAAIASSPIKVAMPSTRATSLALSSIFQTKMVAYSRGRISPTTFHLGRAGEYDVSRPSTFGSSRRLDRVSPCCKCSICSKATTSKRWGRFGGLVAFVSRSEKTDLRRPSEVLCRSGRSSRRRWPN